MHHELLAFVLFAVTAAITPGPSNLLVMNAGLRAGVLGGLPCLAGAVLGMGILIAVAVAGLGGILLANPGLLGVMKMAGATVLLWLAWRIATAPPLGNDRGEDPIGFWKTLLFQWLNPKSWVVSASAAATYGASEGFSIATRAAGLAGTFVLAAAPSVAAWLFFGVLLQKWLSDRKRSRYLNLAMGGTLALSALMIVA